MESEGPASEAGETALPRGVDAQNLNPVAVDLATPGRAHAEEPWSLSSRSLRELTSHTLSGVHRL